MAIKITEASRPWASLDCRANEKPRKHCVIKVLNQDEIDVCLSCKKPRCNTGECEAVKYIGGAKKYAYDTQKEVPNDFAKNWKADGVTIKKLCHRYNVSKYRIKQWIKQVKEVQNDTV